MKIAVVGSGYVGLTTGVCCASLGHDVTCIDITSERVDAINRGEPPFFEPGLEPLLKTALADGVFRATTALDDAVRASDVIIIAVGTPPTDTGIDLSQVSEASRRIARALAGGARYQVVVVKSTAVPGTTDGLVRRLLEEGSGLKAGDFGLCMNPEFLREASAVEDFLAPDRIVIGQWDERSGRVLDGIYERLTCPRIFTGLANAEMIRVRSNALLATLISFSNEISAICEATPGTDVRQVLKGVHLDRRLSPLVNGTRVSPGILDFLRAGSGFGGSCLPKDVYALRSYARSHGVEPHVLDAVTAVNASRPAHLERLAAEAIGSLDGATVAVLGLAFKPGTDDLREVSVPGRHGQAARPRRSRARLRSASHGSRPAAAYRRPRHGLRHAGRGPSGRGRRDCRHSVPRVRGLELDGAVPPDASTRCRRWPWSPRARGMAGRREVSHDWPSRGCDANGSVSRMIKVARGCVGDEELAAVREAFEYGYFGLAHNVTAFEAALQAYLGAPDVVAVNSGTAALHLALDAMGIGPGDEVIVPSLTFAASFQAITETGATAVACDVDPQTLSMDLRDAEARITPRTKALMPVHYTGRPCDLDALEALGARHGLRIVEDAAHAFGSTYRGQRIGGRGDVVCFSFDSIKNITCGEGGAVVTHDRALGRILRQKRVLGIDRAGPAAARGPNWKFSVVTQGYRYHMSNINAAIGLVQLRKLDGFVARRRAICRRYDQAFSGLRGVRHLPIDYDESAPHIYVVRVGDGRRDALMQHLAGDGIETGVNYVPNHLHPYFEKPGVVLPVTDQVYDEILTLPLHCGLSDDDVAQVIAAVQMFFDPKRSEA